MRKFVLFILIFAFISPSTIYAQNMTNIENLIIKTEIQESPETRELLNELVRTQQIQDERFNQLIKELHIDKTTQEKPKDSYVTYDGMFIGSATIAGLFGIGLFTIGKFNEDTKGISASLLQMSVVISGFIISLHILSMLFMISGHPALMSFYIAVMWISAISVAGISAFIGRIIVIENRMKRTLAETEKDVDRI